MQIKKGHHKVNSW